MGTESTGTRTKVAQPNQLAVPLLFIGDDYSQVVDATGQIPTFSSITAM